MKKGCVFEGADNWKLYCQHPKQWRPINPMTEESFVITINFSLLRSTSKIRCSTGMVGVILQFFKLYKRLLVTVC